jgi:hypothetical protein
MLVRSLAFAALASSLLFACKDNASDGLPTASSSDEALTAPRALACAIHYYDSASLPTPHILVVAEGSATTTALATTPLVLATPEGIDGSVGVYTKGFLNVQVSSGASFLTSGSYFLSTSTHFSTDLQVPITPVTKDGITYDRLWIGCAPSAAGAAAATPPVAK